MAFDTEITGKIEGELDANGKADITKLSDLIPNSKDYVDILRQVMQDEKGAGKPVVISQEDGKTFLEFKDK